MSSTPDLVASFKRFRFMAILTGTMLLILTFIAVPLNHIWHHPMLSAIVGPIHGFLYAIYVVVAFDLSRRARWAMSRTVFYLLAGTIPFASFVAEKRARSLIS
jgi:integral membrane protein